MPGIGPIISSAMVAVIGNGAVFGRGRYFRLVLAFVPKTDVDRKTEPSLAHITKRGNEDCRCSSSKQPGVYSGRGGRAGPSTASVAWLGLCCSVAAPYASAAALAYKLARIALDRLLAQSSAAMKRASRRQQPEMNTLRFT